MKKSDLKTGMRVKTRNGNTYMVCLECSPDCLCKSTNILANINGGFQYLDDYEESLTHNKFYDLDILEVYVPLGCRGMLDFDSKLLVWEREEPKEVTLQEIEEKFGCPVKIIKE